MKTVVLFISSNKKFRNPRDVKKQHDNPILTRTLRKIGFIDNVNPTELYPRSGEHWLVEITQENLGKADNRGVFLLKPIHKIEVKPHHLVGSNYGIELREGGTLVLSPVLEKDKFYVISSEAKECMLAENNATAIVINHGGKPYWKRRSSVEEFLQKEVESIKT